ncbi:MAG: sulfite exporter TauE/SafE family protein [Bacteriovoracaceae bacterium]|nr:sulfite exporter TauE/SafE family protein [Bacteriovoracaceae bacterium]
MLSLLLLCLLVTVGSLITSLTGLGGGTLILAGLLLVYPPELAIPLHSFTQFSANALRTGLFFKSVNWRVVASYGLLMLPAAWMAARIFDLINPSILKIMVGIFILFSIIPFKFTPKSEPRPRTFMIIGALSGFLGVFVGAIGPAVVPFFNRLKLSRDGILSTKSAGQMLLQLSKIIAFTGAASINFLVLKDQIWVLILGTLLGVGISLPLGKRISDQKFDLAINILLGLISIKVLVEGLRELVLFNA